MGDNDRTKEISEQLFNETLGDDEDSSEDTDSADDADAIFTLDDEDAEE